MSAFTTSSDACTQDEERGEITNAQGLKLVTYAWKVANPKGAILALHGYGSFAKWEFMNHPGCKYEGGTVEALNAAGFSVYSYDMQGYGESEGARGYRAFVEKYEDYVTDAVQMHAKVKAEIGDKLPLFVLGESMGGNIAAHTVHAIGSKCAGCILACPMLSMEAVKADNWMILPFLQLLDWVVPGLPVGSKAKNDKFPELEDEFQAHPLTFKGAIRVRIGVEFLRAADEALAKAPEVTCPLIFLHSPDDVTCEFVGSKMFYDKCGTKDKTIVTEPCAHMFHAVFYEPGKEKVFAEMCDWLKLRCGSIME